MNTHARSVALMKFLAETAVRLGVADHVYVVGGAVRNFLIGSPIKDIDMVVDAVALGEHRDSAWFARQVADAVPARTEIVTDALMVAKVFIKSTWLLDGIEMEGEVVEIVNARAETYAEDEGHKPTAVTRTTVEEDTYRREFTFNTLLWRLSDLVGGPSEAEVIDVTGRGVRDLENREMRCPADPDRTFGDDPTRIIRTVKFAFKYGFTLPEETRAAARRQAPKLARIPSKTWTVLHDVVLESPQYMRALDVMEDLGVVEVLARMVVADQTFGTTLDRYAQARGMSFMFALMDRGIPVGRCLGFLDAAQRARFREVVSTMTDADAGQFLAALKQPPIDNESLIRQFSLAPRQRSVLAPTARRALLADPSLLGLGYEWERVVAADLARTLESP
jgi:tRNA nucleotidyltransferase (CCA-adding enzyme)